jgi:hypothetical protein
VERKICVSASGFELRDSRRGRAGLRAERVFMLRLDNKNEGEKESQITPHASILRELVPGR